MGTKYLSTYFAGHDYTYSDMCVLNELFDIFSK